MAQQYVDRLGQPVTDPRYIEARRIQTQMRRLITLGVKGGHRHDQAATVGDLAKAMRLPAYRVVEIMRGIDWFWGLTENGPIENWWVWEDGE